MINYLNDGEIITAFAAAQAEFPKLTQDKSGYNYEYLTLPNILNNIRPILGKHGVVFTQGCSIRVIDGIPFVEVVSQVMFKAERIESTLSFPLGDAPKGMSEIQYMGSLQSYLRRYGALGLLGIAGQEKEIEDIQSELKKEI